MSDQTSPDERDSLPPMALADAPSELSRLALAATSLPDFLVDVCEVLARALGYPKAGVFEQFGDSVLLRAGFGWDRVPAALPTLVPDSKPTADVQRLGDDMVLSAGFIDPDDRRAAVVVGPVDGDETGTARGLVGLAADLVAGGWARRQLESELRQSKRWLVEAQELAHMGTYDWNIVTDENVWSDELYRIYGFEPQAFNASYERFLELIHPEDRERITGIHRSAHQTLEPYSMQERIVRPDGTVRTLASTGEVIADEQGRPVRMRGVCIDVTDRLRVVDELARIERAEVGRRQAMEINDNVVQGLTTALWSLESGLADEARVVARRTLESAQAMMSDLLHAGGSVGAGDLSRETVPEHLLPDVDAPPTAAGLPLHEARVPGWTTIVLADDSDDIRLLLRLQLAEFPEVMVVGEAASGLEAVTAAAEHQPDVVLLDMAMPDGDGLTSIPRIRAASPGSTIIALSGFRASELAEPAMQAGASAYAEKGDFDRLLTVLREFVPGLRSIGSAASVIERAPTRSHSSGGVADARSPADHLDELVRSMRSPAETIQGISELLVDGEDLTPESVRVLHTTLRRNSQMLARLLEQGGPSGASSTSAAACSSVSDDVAAGSVD